MITVKLMGGLGNQMFQYAAGFALAKKLGVECAIDLSFINRTGEIHTKRDFELGIFDIHARTLTDEESRRMNEQTEASRLNSLKRIFISMPRIYRERHFHYDDQLFSQPDNTMIVGYWQSEKYFSHIREDIQGHFRFVPTVSEYNKSLIELIRAKGGVSMHVRRGDFVSNPQSAKAHPVCSPEYYSAAMELMAELTKSPVYFVFSDDIEWAKANIRFHGEVVYVSHNNGQSSFEDMRLMSYCRHHIIANSSFSWWGAWLAGSEDQVVVAPRKWFNDPTVNCSDLIPSRWNLL